MMGNATFIGFGEAGRAFAWPGARAFDRKTDMLAERGAMLAAYADAGVRGEDDAATALAGAGVVLSLVTADQAVAASRSYAPMLESGALWLDMNSVAPASKADAAALIEAVGGRYVDVAVMAPVLPQRRNVPLLVSGPHAADAAEVLQALGFANVSIAGDAIGQASAIKMIRSVMVKGLEALSAECAMAASRAGVLDAVTASLDASWKPQGWAERFDYNLDRMMAHGLRRAAEMEEVAATLADLGVDPVMTRGTIQRQREIGTLRLSPPAGLTAKLAALETPQFKRTA
ncbi:3-hydroxyisobutyrate dehydrogenase-like beta-hydroxyacid dehydrogenase [Blastomonas natatoria]|uniref:3-hydroxyisobutyrate dehydrogenase-like beta-hydroxyacid dehydrogenase n=1 Tax=Blastomonas natatoria TaxID=34015 RepID=A0A2V3VRP9_9SPHN|nr:NAD(P)-dependent oxidoreductase [Blastomonas natatoria]PXW79209.1 3-hydroxyisobutyrate dehydrogenase-like beta-hydroxyacid dehydrogenase [Blastomonas natatoria]